VIITPDDPLTPTSESEPTATSTTIPEPTITPTIAEPTATDVIIPQGADIGSKLAFAQSQDLCETPETGGDDPGDGGDTGGDGSSVTGLPSTGSGDADTMAALWFVLASGAGLLLCAAGWASVRKSAMRR
jgi:hypothetical protein